MNQVLTVRQPFASLIIHGIKRYETRTWESPWRGPLLIHAASSIDTAGQRAWNWLVDTHALLLTQMGVTSVTQLPRGCIIGEVNLARVRLTSEVVPTDLEQHIGFFDDYHFAWELTRPKVWQQPVRAHGLPGIWRWRPRQKEGLFA